MKANEGVMRRRMLFGATIVVALLGIGVVPVEVKANSQWQFYIDSTLGPGCGGCCYTGYCCTVPASCTT